jgi:hypothetical protein
LEDPLNRTTLLAALCCAAPLSLGGSCGGPTGAPPSITVTLNAVDDELNDLLVIPADAPVFINATFAPGSSPVDPQSFAATLFPWSGGPAVDGFVFQTGPTGGLALVGVSSLAKGTWTAVAWVSDTMGRTNGVQLAFAVRDRPGPPPIGSGQKIWYDFASDRDAVPGPDFPVDLQAFGLGSPAAPALSAVVHADVVDAVLARVEQTYYDEDPNGFGLPDPVAVDFFAANPGGGDVTRICVGGSDPSGNGVIGSILIDPNNANRSSVECGTIPPTGIFPREMLVYQTQYWFQIVFDPLMPSRGGTPVGESPLDPVVLAPGFDPGSASPAEHARWTAITTAVQRLGDALGSVVAHETGHALGLVAPGPPGGGLHGGQSGVEYAHDVVSDGVTSPTPNYLMKHGQTFSFARLAGMGGNPLPFLRPLDFAYLRDRVMTDPKVTQLLPSPQLTGVTPGQLLASGLLTVTGSGFVATPALRLENASYNYNLLGEALVSSSQATGWVTYIQVPPGLYDLVLENPDGQDARLAGAVRIGP